MHDIKKLFDIAVQIEKNDEAFYREFSNKLIDPAARVLFTYLADEELKHQKTFQDLRDEAHIIILKKESNPAFSIFLRLYVDQLVFNSVKLQDELQTVTSSEAAIKFGLNRESQTILFYEEFKRFAPSDMHHFIDGLIEEEISHYLKLSDFLKRIDEK